MSSHTIAQRLSRRVSETPQGVAFQIEGSDGRWQATSWAEFGHQVDLLRRGLAAAGLQRGDRLAIIAPVSLAWELIHHAALSMGVAVVGLDAHDQPGRVAAMAESAGVCALAVLDTAILGALTPALLARIRVVVLLDSGASPPGTEGRSPQILSLAAIGRLGEAAQLPAAAEPGDLATVIFTSGTTGMPKGIAYSQAQLCLAVDAICDAFSFVAAEGHMLCWLPLSNLFQRMVNLAALNTGVATYLLADPRRVMAVVSAVEPDVFVAVPRFYEKLHAGVVAQIAAQPWPQRQLARWAWRTGHRAIQHRRAGTPVPLALALAHRLADRLVLSRIRRVMGARLRCMVSGSAPMPMVVLEDFEALGWLVLEAYGLSENVLPMAMNRMDDYRLGSVGRPLPGNQIVIGADGAIRVRGDGLFSGYLGDSTEQHRDAQGFYVTGDLGRLDEEGYLSLTGRTGDMIKTSTGRRIAPTAVEAALRAPGLDQVALFGSGMKFLVALCTVEAAHLRGEKLVRLKADLQQAVQRLSPHERPAAIALLAKPFSIEANELTPNLKLRRGAIEVSRRKELERISAMVDAQGQASAATLIVAMDHTGSNP